MLQKIPQEHVSMLSRWTAIDCGAHSSDSTWSTKILSCLSRRPHTAPHVAPAIPIWKTAVFESKIWQFLKLVPSASQVHAKYFLAMAEGDLSGANKLSQPWGELGT